MVMATSSSAVHNSSAAPPSTPYLYHYYPEEADAPVATAATNIATVGSSTDDDAISAIDDNASISVPVDSHQGTTISRILAELRTSDSLCRNITSECKVLNTVLDGYKSILLDEMEAAFAALNSHQDNSAAPILEIDKKPEVAGDKYGSETVPIAERFTPRLMTMSAILSRLR
jgi:hypothetical protein